MKKFRLSIAVLLSVWSLAGLGEANADNGSGMGGVKVEKSAHKKVRVYTKPGTPLMWRLLMLTAMYSTGELLPKITSGLLRSTSITYPMDSNYLTAGNNNWWMSQGLTIKANDVNVDERNVKQVAKPTLTAYEKNKIEVVLPVSNVAESSVSIYDSQNVLVQTDSFKGSVRRFDLSSLPTGAYTFVVGPDQKQFTTRVDIQH